jgi:hypothetical protein
MRPALLLALLTLSACGADGPPVATTEQVPLVPILPEAPLAPIGDTVPLAPLAET